MRYLLAVIFSVLLSAPLAAAPVGATGGLGYSCEKKFGEAGSGNCTCSGYHDCKEMEKVCIRGHIPTCSTVNGVETCTCPWNNLTRSPATRQTPLGNSPLRVR